MKKNKHDRYKYDAMWAYKNCACETCGAVTPILFLESYYVKDEHGDFHQVWNLADSVWTTCPRCHKMSAYSNI